MNLLDKAQQDPGWQYAASIRDGTYIEFGELRVDGDQVILDEITRINVGNVTVDSVSFTPRRFTVDLVDLIWIMEAES